MVQDTIFTRDRLINLAIIITAIWFTWFAQNYFEVLPELGKYAFAVDFITPVDEYQQNERASKYGFLVIGLTFLIFFLIQSISKINIHIFQYSMIGIALIMFYTLLISITEHSTFSFAYLIAGASVIIMISLYSISILKDKKSKYKAYAARVNTDLEKFIEKKSEDFWNNEDFLPQEIGSRYDTTEEKEKFNTIINNTVEKIQELIIGKQRLVELEYIKDSKKLYGV